MLITPSSMISGWMFITPKPPRMRGSERFNSSRRIFDEVVNERSNPAAIDGRVGYEDRRTAPPQGRATPLSGRVFPVHRTSAASFDFFLHSDRRPQGSAARQSHGTRGLNCRDSDG